jgi:hypothetical protein
MFVLDNEEIGSRLELYHMSRLETDVELRHKVGKVGRIAGRQLWKILKPLLLLDIADVSKHDLEELQQQCSEITGIASQLNAQIKARYIAPSIFWPIPGRHFDQTEMSFFGKIGNSRVQMVRIPLCFGIKTDCIGSTPFIHAKSEVDC